MVGEHRPVTNRSKWHWWHIWLRHISLSSLCWMMRHEELCSNVYLFDGQSNSVSIPSGVELPWFVLLLTGAHSKKHIFEGSLPLRKDIVSSCSDMTKRLGWFHLLKDNARPDNARIKVNRPISMPRGIPPIEVQWCAAHLKTKVLQHYDNCCKKRLRRCLPLSVLL